MMNSSKKNITTIFSSMFTIFIVLIFMICYETLQQDGELVRFNGSLTRITIQNNNNYLLGVHCKSKDDDLGFHILKKGELYGWKFRVNFMNSTLFSCGFSHKQDKKKACSTFTTHEGIIIDVEIVHGMQRKMVFMDIVSFL